MEIICNRHKNVISSTTDAKHIYTDTEKGQKVSMMLDSKKPYQAISGMKMIIHECYRNMLPSLWLAVYLYMEYSEKNLVCFHCNKTVILTHFQKYIFPFSFIPLSPM
jgi:hypothetical protein